MPKAKKSGNKKAPTKLSGGRKRCPPGKVKRGSRCMDKEKLAARKAASKSSGSKKAAPAKKATKIVTAAEKAPIKRLQTRKSPDNMMTCPSAIVDYAIHNTFLHYTPVRAKYEGGKDKPIFKFTVSQYVMMINLNGGKYNRQMPILDELISIIDRTETLKTAMTNIETFGDLIRMGDVDSPADLSKGIALDPFILAQKTHDILHGMNPIQSSFFVAALITNFANVTKCSNIVILNNFNKIAGDLTKFNNDHKDDAALMQSFTIFAKEYVGAKKFATQMNVGIKTPGTGSAVCNADGTCIATGTDLKPSANKCDWGELNPALKTWQEWHEHITGVRRMMKSLGKLQKEKVLPPLLMTYARETKNRTATPNINRLTDFNKWLVERGVTAEMMADQSDPFRYYPEEARPFWVFDITEALILVGPASKYTVNLRNMISFTDATIDGDCNIKARI